MRVTTELEPIFTKLRADASLLALLGSPSDPKTAIFRWKRLAKIVTPSVTIKRMGGPKNPFPGTDAAPSLKGSIYSMPSVIIQVDIWASSDSDTSPNTGEDVDLIEQRLDWNFIYDTLHVVVGTFGWKGITSSQQYEEDTRLWHNTVRYGFEYLIRQET